MAVEYVYCSLTSQKNALLRQPIKKGSTLTTANRMLRNCQDDIGYAVPRWY